MATITETGRRCLPGNLTLYGTFAGPASYDATNFDAFDLSDYFSKVLGVEITAVDAAADALVKADYVNDDMTDTDGGVIAYSWTGASGSAVLANVTNTTNLSGYVFHFKAEGYPKNSVNPS